MNDMTTTHGTNIVPLEFCNKMMTSMFEKTSFEQFLDIQRTLMNNQDNELVSQGEEPAHFFANGMYMRTLDIPAGELICGKMHKQEHFTMLTKGSIIVRNQKEFKTYFAPCQWVSEAGVKRFIYAYEDSQLVTVHRTNKTNLQEIEDEIIIKEYL